jgi:hypothetical protein
MYNFKDIKEPPLRYGFVKKGWHEAKIHWSEVIDSKNRLDQHQYLKVDFVVRGARDRYCLVPAFFNHGKDAADPKFIGLCLAAGLDDDYGSDIDAVLEALLGLKLQVFVNHRFKRGRRRDKVEDFKPLGGEDIPF